MEQIYTVPEVARYLKLSKSKVYNLVQRGEIPSIKIGRNVRIRQSDLDQWLDEQTQPGYSDFRWE
jgi:excisionase family DNA binding protein